MIKLYTDAATKGNPGPTGLGALILADQQQIQVKKFAGRYSNHQGEFLAAQFGFQTLIERYPDADVVFFLTDSRLLADAVGKNYSKHYQNELATLLALINQFPTVITQWVPEKANHGAHHLANQALQQGLSGEKTHQ